MEYPKMLYKGNQSKYSHVTALNEEHEEDLKEQGFVNYYDLEEAIESSPDDQNSGVELITQDELDLISKELTDLQLQLNVCQTERDQFFDENNQLKKENRFLKLNNMDATELKNILDEREVKYGSRDGKDVLVNLVVGSDEQE